MSRVTPAGTDSPGGESSAEPVSAPSADGGFSRGGLDRRERRRTDFDVGPHDGSSETGAPR